MTVLIVAALATWQAVEIWHHSSIAAGWRARTELWQGRPGELFGCPFCLSVWAALGSIAVLGYNPPALTGDYASLLGWWHALTDIKEICSNIVTAVQFFLYALAVSRLANLGNDVFHAWCRTPRSNHLTAEDPFVSKTSFENADAKQP